MSEATPDPTEHGELQISQAEALALLHARRSTYALLATVFGAEPTVEFLAKLRDELALLTDPEVVGFAGLQTWFDEQGENLKAARTELAADYARLYLAMSPHPVSPYESVYTSKEHLLMQATYDDVVAEYRAEGLDRAEHWRMPQDHIALELEFMAHLCLKAEDALMRGDSGAYRTALTSQERFLGNHLEPWTPAFCDKTEQSARTGFYRAIVRMMAEHLSYERDAIGELRELIFCPGANDD